MIRPQKRGKKWRIRYLDARGRRISATFSTHALAEKAAVKATRDVEMRRAGLVEDAIPDKTFDELCSYWLEKKAPQKRSGKDDLSIIRKHLLPAFGPMQLRDIGVADVDDFITERDELSDKTIANHVTLLKTMLKLAVELKWLRTVPKLPKPKVKVFDQDFRYLRTEDEIHRFLLAARGAGDVVFTVYALALYTGLRAGELAGLRWDAVSLENRLITVARSFEGLTKSGVVRHVPILSPLLPVLRRWRLLHPGELVFTNAWGNMLGPSGRLYQEVLHRVLDEAKLPKETLPSGRVRRYITFHGLRHTFASHWVMSGGDLFKLQKILGHQSTAMTQRYAHLAPSAFSADHDRLGGVDALEEDAEVLVLRSARS